MRSGKILLKQVICIVLVSVLYLSVEVPKMAVPVEAKARTTTIYISGVQAYDYVQKTLKLINKERKKRGLKTLKLDKGLTKSATTRSAELFVYIPRTSPHRRPNGTLRNTVNKKVAYEICAEGTGDIKPETIVNEWMNSPSHRPGILLKDARSVGIGWVWSGDSWCTSVEFSTSKAKSVVKTKGYKLISTKVVSLTKYVKPKYFRFAEGVNGLDEMHVGSSVRCNMKYTKNYSAYVDNKMFKWTSSDPSVATVNSKGIVTGKKEGTVVITATVKKGTKFKRTQKVNVIPAYGDRTYDGWGEE